MAHTRTHTRQPWTHVPYVDTLTQDLTQDPRISTIIISDHTITLFPKGQVALKLLLGGEDGPVWLLGRYHGELSTGKAHGEYHQTQSQWYFPIWDNPYEGVAF